MRDATAEPDIPQRFEDLTPEWLTATLRRSASLEDRARVRTRRIEIIGEGIGFTGQVARLYLDYEGPADGAPRSLIAKLPTPHLRNRASVEAGQGYEREVYFYQRLAERSGLPVPRCHLAVMDTDPRVDSRPALVHQIERLPVFAMRPLNAIGRWVAGRSKRRYLVLLEDLAPAENGDQVAGCSAERAEQVARGLATFHAAYWTDDGLAALPWLPSVDMMSRAIMAMHRKARKPFIARRGVELPEGAVAAMDWVDSHFEEAARHLATPPYTLLHGDYRLDNLFFEADVIWASDFQAIARGRGAMDLAYFCTGSLGPEVDEGALIDAYCDELGKRGVGDYDRETCERDSRLMKLLQLYGIIAADDIIDLGDERGAKLIDIMRKRLYARMPAPPYDGLLG
jgi:hypothetical protein